jgi:LL-diaminopimelate aminotransferase
MPHAHHSLAPKTSVLPEERLQEVIDLSIGDPSDPTPQKFKDDLVALLADPRADHYPDSVGEPELLEAIARYYYRRYGVELDPENDICVTSGARPALSLALHAAATTRPVCGYAEPAYFGIPLAILAAGLEPRPVGLEHLLGDDEGLDDVFAQVAGGSFVLNSPHNPTGRVFSRDELSRIATAAHTHNVAVAADAVYAELFGSEIPRSFLEFASGAVEVCSFSKTFRMCGWRCGFVVGKGKWIGRLRDLRRNIDNGVPMAIQVAAAGLLEDMTGVAAFRAAINERRQFLGDRLGALGFIVDEGRLKSLGTNFLWVGIPSPLESSVEVSRLLRLAGVNVLAGSIFGASGEGYLRFSLNFSVPVLDEVARRVECALDQRVESK